MNEGTNSTAIADVATKLRGCSVAKWGEHWLLERAEYSQNAEDDARRWSKHVLSTSLASMELADVTEPIAREWLHALLASKKSNGKPLAARTCQNALNLVRTAFTDARENAYIETNPFRALRIPRGRSARLEMAWTVLEPHEQLALLRVIPEPDRWLVEFAMGTGMRQGEQWAVRRRHIARRDDITVACIPRVRAVPLFGMALRATQQQADLLDGKVRFPSLPRWRADADALLWPSPKGGPREKKAPNLWRSWLAEAGIDRRVRWHDLRHTCAASLVSGWWGRAWSLEEVRELLGHSSITVTERYAHFSRDLLGRAARETIAALAIHNAKGTTHGHSKK